MNKWWLVVLSVILSAPLALAAEPATMFGRVWQTIMSIGNLSFLGLSDGSVVVAFTRVLIWILLFTVFFAVMLSLGAGGATPGRPTAAAAFSFLNRNQAIIVAGVIATIGAVFMPAQVLLATGAGWATAISLILVGLPVVGVWWALMNWPAGHDTRATLFLKFLMCLLLFWVLSAMRFHLARMI
ncbi:hypothetical protein HYX11_00290 [Candidatus Woesearchaeota archaeon]|nr:hypothetical protein [Candidatus Woesearchaeota archaeon]